MPDRLQQLHSNPLTAWLARSAGLPNPVTLARADGPYSAELFAGKVAVLASVGDGYLEPGLRPILAAAGADVRQPGELAGDERCDILLVDASGCLAPGDYTELFEAVHPLARRIANNGRVLVLAPPVGSAESPAAAAAARGLEGFTRSLGKELGARGTTVNLAYVSRAAAERLEMLVRFFCGPQSAYVSGQALDVSADTAPPAAQPTEQVLAGKVALVTGAARGIGLATARRLRQEGATVVALDVPAAADDLAHVRGELEIESLALDITAADAPAQLGDFLREKFGGLDILVHNAGITRDKTLGKMQASQWQQVMEVNLEAVLGIDAALLEAGLVRDEARLVYLSSMSGIAGNFGQTNYATTKAALIGYVDALGRELAARGICANAVAPGFIETAMTGKMPFFTREVGRRLNSLKQGGEPRDVAELVCFLASPGAYGVNGNTIRVCGQALIGA
ncbi:3-oxoacyl-ACP reductase [Microbulbifer yueqingensis]|uniref:3-oxoacyl-[acyl-carrier protein] reductase n=1 Tax=Microbulbifer yueqingensis TaxID=658219 RepID=A0A1G8VA22_9GAMM|nr:3-oxoacyl-ACP reductase [Microbulbifer yueqingensis]SDJ62921.1 3-oxoacyl-[acyl-carrier protein] reductase [Microbulbifer yueqingensis]